MKYSEALERATARRQGPAGPWTDAQFREQRDRDLEPTPMRVAGVIKATFLCLAIAALLSSARLVEIAERQPFGTTRDVWLDAANAVDRVAHTLWLDRPAAFLTGLRSEDSAGLDVDDIDRFVAAEETAPQPAAPSVAPPVTAGAVLTTAPPPVASDDAAVLDPVAALAPGDRLSIVTIGDSQAEPLGYELINVADAQWDVVLDTHIATGLSRPDVFNWPAQIDGMMSADPAPDVVVMFLGGNDAQDMQRGGVYYARGSEEWADEYRLRVQIAMDLMEGSHVFWVNQPPVSDAEVTAAALVMNDIFASEAAARPWVDLVDADDLFASESGGFTAFLTMEDGSTIKARTDDGVHLTRDGADLLASDLAELVRQRFPVQRSAG